MFQARNLINTTNTKKARLAASSYLNSAPLIWSFQHSSQRNDIELIEAVPARCGEMLAQGLVDVALVPAIEYQRIPDLVVVPGVCVGSREKVRSVNLVSKLDDLKDVRRVALDESSRTSATLVKIIFQEFFAVEPEWVSSAPDLNEMLAENDAALIIGDPGMTFSPHDFKIFDMASLWRRHTGHGFVFAIWMISPTASAEARAIDFLAACQEGLARTEEIIDFYLPLLGLPREELQIYLNENLSFIIDDELRAGLDLYYQLAYKHKLIPAVKPLNLGSCTIVF
ncbi:MAG: menaquinone biosynthesis protein [bacterium]